MNIIPIYQNGYGKEYWGPRLWYLLHKIAYNYPLKPSDADKSFYLKYFSTIVRIIPCPYCANHFFTTIQNDRLHQNLENRQLVIDWFKNAHNKVNISNGKRTYIGFEIDMIYQNVLIDHDALNELILYLFHLTENNTIETSIFIYWILTTYKIHPCIICRNQSIQYFILYDISKNNWNDSNVLKNWVNGLININRNH